MSTATKMVLQATAQAAITGRRFVGIHSDTAAEDFQVATVTSGVPLGIAELDAAADEGVNVIIGGRCKLSVDATTAITEGDQLKPSTGGVGVKAAVPGDETVVIADEPLASGTGVIWVHFEKKTYGANPVVITNATDTVAITAAQMGLNTTAILSVAGTAALSIPGAATLLAGTRLTVKKTGTAGAITITPAAGTIGGGATHTALDAQNDIATFVASGSDWVLVSSNIA